MLKHIILREFRALAGNRGQKISTAVILILILGLGVAGKYFLSGGSGGRQNGPLPAATQTVGLSSEFSGMKPLLAQLPFLRTEDIPPNADPGRWLGAQTEKDRPARLAIAGTADEPKIYEYGEADEKTVDLLKKGLMSYTATKIIGEMAPEQQQRIARAGNPRIVAVADSATAKDLNLISFTAAIIVLMLMFFAIMTGVGTVSAGVVEEKSSRVVEILLSSVRPRTLLLGKVLGIGSFVLLQVVLYVAALSVSVHIAGLQANIGISPIASMLIWVVIGFFIFVSLTGGLAATASRQEDLGSVTMIVTFALLIPFYISMFFIPNFPHSPVTEILSLIPGFSSFMMPIRNVYGTVALWQSAVAIAAGIAAIPLISAVAGKIYENSVLHTGQRISILKALRKR